MNTYQHSCPFCGYKWSGRKKNPVSCSRCKRRFDAPARIPGRVAALRWVEVNLIQAGLPPSVAKKEAKHRLSEIVSVTRK